MLQMKSQLAGGRVRATGCLIELLALERIFWCCFQAWALSWNFVVCPEMSWSSQSVLKFVHFLTVCPEIAKWLTFSDFRSDFWLTEDHTKWSSLRGSTPDLAGWACSAPPDPLAGNNNHCNIENCYVTLSYILGILHTAVTLRTYFVSTIWPEKCPEIREFFCAEEILFLCSGLCSVSHSSVVLTVRLSDNTRLILHWLSVKYFFDGKVTKYNYCLQCAEYKRIQDFHQ